MTRVVLGVSGSVAAYRAADLARELMRRGCEVRVCLTDAGAKFVSAALFEALTGQPCLQDVFDEPERGRMAHIDWARQADVLVVAPATENTISKLAHGGADDMLSTIAVAYEGPILVAPAMNPSMYASAVNQENLRLLRERSVEIVEPVVGDVACGESGQGKFADVARIADEVMVLAAQSQALAGRRVLITSGPTQEPIDSARFLSNRSSGKMGAALVRAALAMGAEVTVVAGPSAVVYPARANVVSVRTAEQMLRAALSALGGSDWVIGAAAVADYRPTEPAHGKIRRSDEPISLPLVPNPDVIATLAAQAKASAKVVGFAAEPGISDEEVRAKMVRKGLFAIAANDISRSDVGFESDDNELVLHCADGRVVRSPRQSKLACGFWLWNELLK